MFGLCKNQTKVDTLSIGLILHNISPHISLTKLDHNSVQGQGGVGLFSNCSDKLRAFDWRSHVHYMTN